MNLGKIYYLKWSQCLLRSLVQTNPGFHSWEIRTWDALRPEEQKAWDLFSDRLRPTFTKEQVRDFISNLLENAKNAGIPQDGVVEILSSWALSHVELSLLGMDEDAEGRPY